MSGIIVRTVYGTSSNIGRTLSEQNVMKPCNNFNDNEGLGLFGLFITSKS